MLCYRSSSRPSLPTSLVAGLDCRGYHRWLGCGGEVGWLVRPLLLDSPGVRVGGAASPIMKVLRMRVRRRSMQRRFTMRGLALGVRTLLPVGRIHWPDRGCADRPSYFRQVGRTVTLTAR